MTVDVVGIENVGEFFSQHYLDTLLGHRNARTTLARATIRTTRSPAEFSVSSGHFAPQRSRGLRAIWDPDMKGLRHGLRGHPRRHSGGRESLPWVGIRDPCARPRRAGKGATAAKRPRVICSILPHRWPTHSGEGRT
jgi:hypothetical protein